MDKYNSYMEDFINTFDVAVIPEELYKIGYVTTNS